MVDCMKRSAWKFPPGISPFGNYQHFLYRKQITPMKVKGKHSQHKHHIRVSFVMKPLKSYPDPFVEIFDESQV